MEKALQISATNVNFETVKGLCVSELCVAKEITKHADHIPQSLWARKIEI